MAYDCSVLPTEVWLSSTPVGTPLTPVPGQLCVVPAGRPPPHLSLGTKRTAGIAGISGSYNKYVGKYGYRWVGGVVVLGDMPV